MGWTLIAVSGLTFASTFLGGTLALRVTGSLRYFFAFSAGPLLAIALTDLLPEAIAASPETPGARLAVCYVSLASSVLPHVVARYVLVHLLRTHEADGRATPAHEHDQRHPLRALR